MQSGANSRGVPALVNPSLRALVTLTESEALPQPHPENWLAIEQLIRELQRVSFYAVNIGADKLADLYVLKRKAAWRHELATNPHAPRFLFRVPPRRNPAVQIP